jgi:hypothetical protein
MLGYEWAREKRLSVFAAHGRKSGLCNMSYLYIYISIYIYIYIYIYIHVVYIWITLDICAFHESSDV